MSDLTSDLKSVTFITYISMCILLIRVGPLTASEATTASKQPWRSNFSSDLKSATSITYLSMCILLICFGHVFGPFWGPWGHYSLQMASDLKFHLRFGICGPNCIWNHVCLGCLGLLWKFQRRRRRLRRQLASTRVACATAAATKNSRSCSIQDLR